MSTLQEKISFFVELAGKHFTGSGTDCPNCGEQSFDVVDRKYVVAALRRCQSCRLLYRTPTDDILDSKEFYQSNYSQGFTTEMPDTDQLDQLLKTKFAGTEKSFVQRIEVLEALGVTAGQHIFDFGCSWGYGAWQLAQTGYRVTAHEISLPRGAFATEKLGVAVVPDMPASRTEAGPLAGAIDCFFSSHVIEHVPQPRTVFENAKILLKPGGLFVGFTPNGSMEMRAVKPGNWHSIWGKVHPNMIDVEFYKKTLGPDILLASSPYDLGALRAFALGGRPICDVSGDELLCVARF